MAEPLVATWGLMGEEVWTGMPAILVMPAILSAVFNGKVEVSDILKGLKRNGMVYSFAKGCARAFVQGMWSSRLRHRQNLRQPFQMLEEDVKTFQCHTPCSEIQTKSAVVCNDMCRNDSVVKGCQQPREAAPGNGVMPRNISRLQLWSIHA